MNTQTVNRVKGIVSQMKHLTDELDSLMNDLGIEASDSVNEDLDPYAVAMASMHQKISDQLPEDEKLEVFYSAYTTSPAGFPVDNLDKVAIKGLAVIQENADDFFDVGEDYISDILENPTWLTLAVIANRIIITTGDYNHQFLEGVCKTAGAIIDEGVEVPVYELSMGS